MSLKQSPRAVQLISIDEHKQLKLEQEAVEIIQSFSDQCKNFAVVVVVGKYRTGKSYLINQVLLQQKKGFQVGSTVNACTKGLWMWSELIFFDPGKGKEPIPAILLDTEGIGSIEEEQNHDVKIFLLAMLMSSYFIYNSVGTIDDMALQNLGLIVNLTKMLQKADESTQKDLFDTFPSFLWILRDFTLRLEDEFGNKITPKEYLENALKPLKGFSETIENKNKIRRHITQFFQERDCITLVRPTQNEKDLQHLSSMDMDELRIEFQEQIQALRKKFSFRVQLKQYKGKPTTPYSFVEMCKHFVVAINEGNLPVIESQWQMICKQELNRTLIGSIQIYKNCVDELLSREGVTIAEFEQEHKNYQRKVRNYLDQNCLDKENEEFKFTKKQIKMQIDELHCQAQKKLDKMHEENLERIANEFIQELEDQNKSIWNQIDYWNEVNNKIWNSGSNQQLLMEYIQQIQKTVVSNMFYEYQKSQNQLRSLNDSGVLFQNELKESKTKLKQQEDDFMERMEYIEQERNQLKVELELEKNKCLRLQSQITQSQSNVDTKIGEYMVKLKQIEKSYNEQLLEKDELVINLEQKQKQQQTELDKYRALQKQQEQLNQQEINQLRREIERLKDELTDKSDIISKLKQSMAEDTQSLSQYSSLQPRRQKQQQEIEQQQKEMYEIKINSYQTQIEDQKKIIQQLLDTIQTQKLNTPQEDNSFHDNNLHRQLHNKASVFMTLLHQLMGAYLQLQHTIDDQLIREYKGVARQLFTLIEDENNASGLSERNADSLKLEKTRSSESPKQMKSVTQNYQNINPFRSPDQPKYQNSKMTIMQMFMQQKNKEREQEKMRKSSQLENQLKHRNNMHLQKSKH